MFKKGCLLGALFTVSFLGVPADAQTKKPDPPRTKAEPSWEVLVRSAPANRTLTAAKQCPSGPGGSCKITVSMGATCVTTQKPRDEYLRVNENGDITIFWQLDSATARNWRFDSADGVTFDNPAKPLDNNSSPSPVLYKWHVQSSPAKGMWYYKIKLVARSGSDTCEIDPAIWI